MINCPNCNHEIDSSYFECERGCDLTEIWWCDNCGAIAYGWDGDPPEDNTWDFINKDI